MLDETSSDGDQLQIGILGPLQASRDGWSCSWADGSSVRCWRCWWLRRARQTTDPTTSRRLWAQVDQTVTDDPALVAIASGKIENFVSTRA
jgi:hypothetical protein